MQSHHLTNPKTCPTAWGHFCLKPKTLTPSAKREVIRIMTEEHDLPIVRACQVARLSRAAYYKPGIDWATRDGEVIAALQAVVVEEQRWGFWKCRDRRP